MGADHAVGVEKSRLLAMVGIVAARRRRRPTRMTPQRSGSCERGGEERQERRASKVKVAARIHQVNITILNQALRLGSACTAAACCGMCVGRGGGWDLLGGCCEKVGRWGRGGGRKRFRELARCRRPAWGGTSGASGQTISSIPLGLRRPCFTHRYWAIVHTGLAPSSRCVRTSLAGCQ